MGKKMISKYDRLKRVEAFPRSPTTPPEHSEGANQPEVQALVRQSEITELNLLRLASDAARIDDLQQQLAFLANELGQALAAFEKGTDND